MDLPVLRILTVAIACCSSSAALAADSKGTLTLNLENDLFGSGNDRHYTHGGEIGYVSDTYQPSWLLKTASKLPFYETTAETRVSWVLGQKMFTPSDLTRSDLIVDDRPYAGWLYTGIGLITDDRTGVRHLDKLELLVGTTGPDSGAESTQRQVHQITDSQPPRGWDNQLDDEVTVDVIYQRQWTLPIIDNYIDVVPLVGFDIGTAVRYVNTGLTFRIGSGTNSDYGPPLIRPSSPGSGYFRSEQAFYWYLFAGVNGRYVEHNLFLEGNSDGNSHGVDIEPWVGDVQLGAVMGAGNWRLTLTNIARTREFKIQNEADEFGSIAISYRF